MIGLVRLFGFCFSLFVAMGLYFASSAVISTSAEAATKKQQREAMRRCKRKYGKTVYRAVIKRNGNIICHYGPRNVKAWTEEQVRAWCRKKYYMSASIRVFKINGKWRCEWRS